MKEGTASQRLRPFKPQRFGRYTLLMPISTGGMGEIFLARLEGAHGFDKLCVIKKILPQLAEDQEFVERFVDEARILVKLSHGNIAQVLDMGVFEGAPYIALEFIDGKDLRRVLSRMRDRQLTIPLSFVLYVMLRVLDALAYAHRKRGDDDRDLNLVHRDVSPQNVLISYEGEVKVIDFGLAKSTLSSSKTNPSIIMGKFLYMSPEQARHQKADRRSDLYAVGLCLYELVTGKNPFDEVPPGELMAQVANPAIRPLLEVDPLCPPALSDAVMRALSPDPATRYQSAEELRARLQALLVELDPEAGPESAARFMREAFAVEYQAERRTLQGLREQAKALDEPGLEQAGPAETSHDGDAEDGEGDLDQTREASEELAGLPSTTMELPRAVADGPPASRHEAPRAESLSFQPTRKSGVGPTLERKRGEGERETVAGFAAPPAVAEERTRPGARSLDTMPTELEMPRAPTPAAPMASIVVDQGPDGELEPAAAPAIDGSDPAVPTAPPPRPTPVRRAAGKTDPRRRKVERGTGERKKFERPAPPPPPVPAAPPRPKPLATSPSPVPAKPPQAKGGGGWVWLVLPVLSVLAVGTYIAWDVYSEQLKTRQQEEERRAHAERDLEAGPDRRSREVKVARPVEDEVVVPVKPDAGPEKDVRKPKAGGQATGMAAAPRSTASPGEAAVRGLKSDFEKLVDESAAKKYRLKVTKLELELPSRGADPAWVAEVRRLDEEIRGVLNGQ